MRRIILVFTTLIMSGMWLTVAEASVARGGGGARPAVGNRSAGNVNRGNVNRGNVNRGNVNRGNVGNVNRNNINRNSANRNLNNTNINRTNVNANGWGNHYWNDDHNWGWGSFAGGAAAAATGAAVGAAVANRNTDNTVVAAPAPGTVVSTLPADCSASGGSCGGVNYQPSFDGSNVVYQVTGQ